MMRGWIERGDDEDADRNGESEGGVVGLGSIYGGEYEDVEKDIYLERYMFIQGLGKDVDLSMDNHFAEDKQS